MSTSIHRTVHVDDYYAMTKHAWEQMCGRGLSPDKLRRALSFGRIAHARGATIYVVGRKEVERFRRKGIDLTDLEGIQVVCSEEGAIMTVYRNRDLRRLKPRRRRRWH